MTTRTTPDLRTATSTGSLNWRIGLLVITVVMGASLVLSGLDRYRASVDAARAVTEAEAASVMGVLRRELGRNRPLDQRGSSSVDEALDAVFEDLALQGVTYIAMLDADGAALLERGEPRRRAILPDFAVPMGNRNRIAHVGDVGDGIIHAFMPAGRPGMQRHGGPRTFLFAEMTPGIGAGLISSARRALLIEIGAAALLLLAAGVFWRMSRRAERLALQMERERAESAVELERDRQLKMLGQMSAVLGHELRNPLAALKGHAQLFAEAVEGDDRTRPRVDRIVEEAVQLENLVQQVLDFARTGALDLRRVYIDDLVGSAVAFAEADPVIVTVPAEMSPWLLDRAWMERVLVNLLRNARQASAPGSPVEIIARAGKNLTIEVRDHGSGIPPGDEERIFEPFFTGKARGTGLGLTLARRIILAHGGTVRATNHPEGGAIFTLELPEPGNGS